MKGILLAAGFGKRLKPISDLIPKCLVPINGRPLLDIWLSKLFDSNQIEQILINTHYKNELVNEFIINSTWSDRVTISHEKELHGTAGTILKNRDFLNGEDFFVAHADNLSSFNFNHFVKKFVNNKLFIKATMMTFETNDPKSCGIVKLKDGIVSEFFEKSEEDNGNLANAAVYIMKNEVIGIIEELNIDAPDISIDLLPKLIGKMNTFHNNRFHIDIGNFFNWNNANKYYVDTEPFLKENQIVWDKIIKSL